jgi:hypothetical protein
MQRIYRFRSHYPDERRDPFVRISALAKRAQRVLLYGRSLAGLSQDRLLTGHSRLIRTAPAAMAADTRAHAEEEY